VNGAPSVDQAASSRLVKTQKGVVIEHQVVEGANHFFDGKVDELTQTVETYLPPRHPERRRPARRGAGRARPELRPVTGGSAP
jgi:hypothetical protein